MSEKHNIGSEIIRSNIKLLEKSLQNTQEAVLWVSKSRRIIYSNISVCKTLGYSQKECVELGYHLVDSYAMNSDWDSYWTEIKQKSFLRYETDYICKGGEKVPMDVSATYIEIDNEEYLSLFAHDIYKRREIEKELQTTAEQFRLIAEKSIDGIMHLDKHGEVVYASPSCRNFFGIETQAILGKIFQDLIDPDYREMVQENFEKAIAGKMIPLVEFALNTDAEREVFVGANMVKFVRSDSRLIIQLILRDISQTRKIEEELDNSILSYENILVETEFLNANLEKEIGVRKQVQKELMVAQRDAELANKAKSEFLANMSHEIRTPLNAVLGFAEILKEKLNNRPDISSYIDGISTGGRSLLSLINDILDLSKIEAGKLEIQTESVNPRILIDEVEQIFGKKISDKGLTLETELIADMTKALIIDHTRIRQIIFNLVGNAIKFTTQGHVGIKIEVIPDKKRSDLVELLLSVSDTGMGIPPEQQQQIFEPFEQQEGQSTRKFGGTGLGLSITMRLTEMMHGKLKLESRVKEGSVFTVSFPDIEIEEYEAIAGESGDINLNNVLFEGSRVLLVEDTISNQQVFIGLLESHNLRIQIANHGEEALEMMNKEKPDLVFMDLRMPVMDGKEATKRIRSNEDLKDIPVIILSASLLKNYSDADLELFDDSLAKPLKKSDLLRVLIKHLPHSFIQSSESAFNELNIEIDTEIVFPELDESEIKNLKRTITREIAPLLTALKEFFDAEDAGILADKLNQAEELFSFPAYKAMGQRLQGHVDRFELSQVNVVLTSLEKINEKIIEKYGI